jgi:hypothetical protein
MPSRLRSRVELVAHPTDNLTCQQRDVMGPAPICSINQAMPNTNEAPGSPAVSSTG